MNAITINAVTDLLSIARVSFGSDSTSKELWEYKINGFLGSPVGTIKEWKAFAKAHGYLGLRIIEKDGSLGFSLFHDDEEVSQ